MFFNATPMQIFYEFTIKIILCFLIPDEIGLSSKFSLAGVHKLNKDSVKLPSAMHLDIAIDQYLGT